jgi:hypothetical protein
MAIDDDMALIAHLVDDIDEIARIGFATYRGYEAAILVEHDRRAAATCTYCHMVAEADRRFMGRVGIIPHDVAGLKVWLVGGDAVLRLKKMDEDGHSRNYPTKQARDYDRGEPLPGLPPPAIRLTAGYLLDETETQFIHTQIAKPKGRRIDWCAALVPPSPATGGRCWMDVTRQKWFPG